MSTLPPDPLLDRLLAEYCRTVATITPTALDAKLRGGIAVMQDLDLSAAGAIDKSLPAEAQGHGPHELIVTARMQRIVDALSALTLRDSLTGLFNRRYFDHRLDQELRRARRERTACSLLVADIDRFKQVNDTYGHPVGDAVLIEVAERLGDELRNTDTVARVGGEEFAVILPIADRPGAIIAAERVRARVNATPIQTEVGPLEATVSVGVACRPCDVVVSAEQLIRNADRALYAAKRGGRDRIVVFDDDGPAHIAAGVSRDEKEALLL